MCILIRSQVQSSLKLLVKILLDAFSLRGLLKEAAEAKLAQIENMLVLVRPGEGWDRLVPGDVPPGSDLGEEDGLIFGQFEGLKVYEIDADEVMEDPIQVEAALQEGVDDDRDEGDDQPDAQIQAEQAEAADFSLNHIVEVEVQVGDGEDHAHLRVHLDLRGEIHGHVKCRAILVGALLSVISATPQVHAHVTLEIAHVLMQLELRVWI